MPETSNGSTADPYISIVLTGRNDNFGGDFNERFWRALRFNHEQLSAAGVAHEFIFVEWAPIAGKPYLADLTRAATPELSPEDLTVYIVDPRYHDALTLNSRLKFLEFIAKNVGIRRSRAPFVLTTNTDVYLSRGVIDFLTQRRLEPNILYRAVRIDLKLGTDLTHLDWTLLEDPSNYVLVNEITPPLYTNASGDFLLMDRLSYGRLGGFNEVYRVAKIHLDGNFCAKAYANGYRLVDVGVPVYHLNHVGSFTVTRGIYEQRPGEAPWGHNRWKWNVTYENPDDWGLDRAPERRVDAHTTRLEFSWAAVPPMVDLKRVQLPGARGEALPR